MEAQAPINPTVRLCTSPRRWLNQSKITRQFKHSIEHRKGALLGLVAFLAFGQLVHYNIQSLEGEDELSPSLSKGSSLSLTLTASQMSNPTMIQFLARKSKDFELRRELAQNVCKNLTQSSPKYKPRNATINFDILWDHHYKMAYCPTPRTGLTVWNRYFAALAHLPYWPQWLTKMWLLVRKIYNMPSCLTRNEMLQIVDESLTFTFVRHPFVRLVAVYNDRVVSSNFNGWKAEILKMAGKAEGDEVKFSDFVEFVLRNSAGDSEHLDTFYHHCDMCRIRYDLIGKFETFADDTRYILLKTGAHEKLDLYDEKLSWFTNRPHSSTSQDAALPYFRSLTKETILKLFLRYEMDFEMFGYSAEEFYEQGRETK